MPQTITLHKPRSIPAVPSGGDSLRVRERYLRRRSLRRRLSDRGVTAIWVSVAALLSWLVVVGLTTLGR
jgi:hypothetical protein